jgi:glycosyltransferase involved in cell wall biosynthesis
MYRGSFPIDVARFRHAIGPLSADDRSRLRVDLGLSPEAIVVLLVGKLIGIKRPLDFVEAIARLRDATPRIEGLIVGSGPLESQVRRRIQELNMHDRIRMSGFVNQSEMPRVLWIGDILAMCSEKDPHPLAVSEAMAVGNAIVASDRVGCVGPTDAARPGRNALTYACGDIDALAARLRELAAKPEQLESMRRESWKLAQSQDVEAAAGAVISFLQEMA